MGAALVEPRMLGRLQLSVESGASVRRSLSYYKSSAQLVMPLFVNLSTYYSSFVFHHTIFNYVLIDKCPVGTEPCFHVY